MRRAACKSLQRSRRRLRRASRVLSGTGTAAAVAYEVATCPVHKIVASPEKVRRGGGGLDAEDGLCVCALIPVFMLWRENVLGDGIRVVDRAMESTILTSLISASGRKGSESEILMTVGSLLCRSGVSSFVNSKDAGKEVGGGGGDSGLATLT